MDDLNRLVIWLIRMIRIGESKVPLITAIFRVQILTFIFSYSISKYNRIHFPEFFLRFCML